MLLLENFNIPASVYSTVVTQLVSKASAQVSKPHQKIYLISRGVLDSVVRETLKLKVMYETDQTNDDIDHAAVALASLSKTASISRLVQNAIKNNERHEKEGRTTFRVTLDDAVETLMLELMTKRMN